MSLSKKFVDLVFELSNKYPALDPSIAHVNAGDYGNVNSRTGEWEPEGSIFNGFNVKKEDVLKEGAGEEFRVCSNNATATRLPADESSPTSTSGGEGFRYDFKGERGVLVYVPKMICRYLDIPAIRHLVTDDRLANRFLVTQTWHAPSFVSYMSKPGGSSLVLSIGSNGAPVARAVGTDASLEATFKSQRGAALYRAGYDPSGTASYSPFYVLKQTRQTLLHRMLLFRDSPEPEDDDGTEWQTSPPPWKEVDDDGEDIEPVPGPPPVFF